jgi:hypothetical protein
MLIFLTYLMSYLPSESSMSYEECAIARVCRVQGLASAQLMGHVWMARLQLSDGRCVAISLPEHEIRRVRNRPARIATYEGRVYPSYSPQDIEVIRVAGRRVGISQCGEFFVFVR